MKTIPTSNSENIPMTIVAHCTSGLSFTIHLSLIMRSWSNMVKYSESLSTLPPPHAVPVQIEC